MSTDLVTFNANDLAMLSAMPQDDDFGSSDLSYAWLRISQTNSPQATKGHEAYIPGLEPGMFFNSLTGFVYGQSVDLIYQKMFHSFSEHEPDGKNRFIRSITEDEFEAGKADGTIIFLKKGEAGFRGKSSWYLGNNIVKDTINYMVALPNYPEDGVLRLGLSAGGNGKHCKVWNTMLANTYIAPGKKAPKLSFVWKLTLALESKPDGNYFAIGSGAKTNVEKVGPTPSSFMAQAIAGYNFFQGLDVKTVVEADVPAHDDNPL
jgi:hypothetical protein